MNTGHGHVSLDRPSIEARPSKLHVQVAKERLNRPVNIRINKYYQLN